MIDWRLPRVLAAACVGALLGLGGTVFQGVFRNPLAEPYLLGSAGGAALGATVALLVPLAAPQSFVLPVLAFAGAWGATMLVIGISRVAGAVDAAGMLLAGVAVAAVLSALRSFLMLALSDETVSLQIVLSWVLGGVQTPTWPILGLLAAISIACLALTLLLAGRLDVLGLGETMAIAFGLNVNRFIAFAVLAGSVVVAAAVAFGGLVAFVGLASPHIARWLVGPLHRPLAAGIGAGRRHRRHPGRRHRALGAAAGRDSRSAWSRPLPADRSSSCCWPAGCAHDRHRGQQPYRQAQRCDVARRPVAVARSRPDRSPSSAPTARASRRC